MIMMMSAEQNVVHVGNVVGHVVNVVANGNKMMRGLKH